MIGNKQPAAESPKPADVKVETSEQLHKLTEAVKQMREEVAAGVEEGKESAERNF